MPKQKSHRGASKRFKVTAGGKVLRRNSMANHIMSKKTTKRKRRLRKPVEVQGKFARTIKKIIGDEDKSSPLSDQAIVDLLEQTHGIKIARRTVTKYRERAGIAAARLRRKY